MPKVKEKILLWKYKQCSDCGNEDAVFCEKCLLIREQEKYDEGYDARNQEILDLESENKDLSKVKELEDKLDDIVYSAKY